MRKTEKGRILISEPRVPPTFRGQENEEDPAKEIEGAARTIGGEPKGSGVLETKWRKYIKKKRMIKRAKCH